MHSNAPNRDRIAAGRVAGVTLLIMLLMGLAVLSSSPALHLRVCPNAGRPDHHCAASDFAAGLAEVPPAMVIGLAALVVLFARCCAPEILHRVSPVFRLSPSRAPPRTVRISGQGQIAVAV